MLSEVEIESSSILVSSTQPTVFPRGSFPASEQKQGLQIFLPLANK